MRRIKFTDEENKIVNGYAKMKWYDNSLNKRSFENLKQLLFDTSGIERSKNSISTKYYETCYKHLNPNYYRDKSSRKSQKNKGPLPQKPVKENKQTPLEKVLIMLQEVSTKEKEMESLIASFKEKNERLSIELEDCKNELRALKKLREAVYEYKNNCVPNLKRGIIL